MTRTVDLPELDSGNENTDFLRIVRPEQPGAVGGREYKIVPNNLNIGGSDPAAVHDNVSGEIAAITEKTSPVEDDLALIEDSEDSNNKKSVKLGNILDIRAQTLAFQGAIGMLQMFPGLVGLWPGSSLGTGTTGNSHFTDMSGHGIDLARTGSTFTFGGTVGLFSNYWFNGSTGYASHADASILDIIGTESGVWVNIRGLTIGGWFLFDQATPAAEEYLLGKYGPTGNQRSYLLKRTTDGRGQMQASTNGGSQFNSGSVAVLEAGVWYFLVGRFSPSAAITLLVNGEIDSQNTTSIPATLFDSTAQFGMAANPAGPSNFFDGQASLCFLCAAAVPDSMIQAFYQQTRALFGI